MQPFPLTFPPLNASATHPNPNIDFSPFLPQAGMTAPPPSNTYPYNENYFFSIERQLWREHAAELELCRLAGAPSVGDLLGESRQSGSLPGAEPAQRGRSGIADLRTDSAKTRPTPPPPGRSSMARAGRWGRTSTTTITTPASETRTTIRFRPACGTPARGWI